MRVDLSDLSCMETIRFSAQDPMMSEDASPPQISFEQSNYVELTADLVAAYVSKNAVSSADLPALISTIHSTLGTLATGAKQGSENQVEKPTPAQIKKSIKSDTLISFVDGKPYKMLKRHLGIHGLTPETYREKYGLPATYPMVAAGHSAQRAEIARSMGLGLNRRKPKAGATE